MNDSVAHHFVPQHLQRNFASGHDHRLAVFDVTDGRTFSTGSEVLMQRGHFHSILAPGRRLNVEDIMTGIENSVIDTYEGIVRHGKVPLDGGELDAVALLVAFQELRTSKFRNTFLRVEEQLRQHLEKFGASLEDIEGYAPFDETRLKAGHLLFLCEHFEGFARIIRRFDFVLMRPPAGGVFYLGDSPVVRYNKPTGIWSNLGLASKGLQLQLPLSKDLLLGIWSPDIIRRLEDGQAETRRLHAKYTLSPGINTSGSPPEYRDAVEKGLKVARTIEGLLAQVRSGEPIQLENEQLEFYNSLQLSHAERHVLCPGGDYTLAKRWFSDFGTKQHQSHSKPMG